jgi:protoheme IX farnesyltransferase
MPKQLATTFPEATQIDSRVRDYFNLLKPRVMYLVVFTGLTGQLLAPGHIHPLIAFVAILCIAIGSGAAGAINMWYERDIDGLMSRTKFRPIPSGHIAPEDALHFGIILASSSVILMGLVVNLKSSLMLLSTIVFYIVIYTIWLKPRTPQNIVIGGAAGSFPPIIGWLSVTNHISIEPITLFLIIFMWTPPHFWALALNKSDDYAKASIPMLPIVKGIKNTKIQIFIYTIILILTSLLPYFVKLSGLIYLSASMILGALFILESYLLLRDDTNKRSMRVFSFSIFYLFLLFSFLIFDNLFRSL